MKKDNDNRSLKLFESFVSCEIQICRARGAMHFWWMWAFNWFGFRWTRWVSCVTQTHVSFSKQLQTPWLDMFRQFVWVIVWDILFCQSYKFYLSIVGWLFTSNNAFKENDRKYWKKCYICIYIVKFRPITVEIKLVKPIKFAFASSRQSRAHSPSDHHWLFYHVYARFNCLRAV